MPRFTDHAQQPIGAEELRTLDLANHLELVASADAFAEVAADILSADSRFAAERQVQRDALEITPSATIRAAE